MNAKQKTHAVYAVVATALALTALAASQAEADQIIRDDGTIEEVPRGSQAVIVPDDGAICLPVYIIPPVPPKVPDICDSFGSKGSPIECSQLDYGPAD